MRAAKHITGFACAALALLCAATMERSVAQQAASAAAAPQEGHAVVLDRVVAAINGSIILQSDVNEEMHFAAFQAPSDSGHRSEQAALQRIINRDLILQQMKEGQAVPPPTAQEVEKQLSELRKQIPECASYHCDSEAGWQAFLHAQDLTEPEVRGHWAQRMLILDFIQARFGAGVHISATDIKNYYDHDLVPEFAKRKMKPPDQAAVSSRIEEILLQQRVNGMLEEWLQSLKSEGSVSILDPAYGQVGTTGSGEDDDAGGQQ